MNMVYGHGIKFDWNQCSNINFKLEKSMLEEVEKLLLLFVMAFESAR